MHSSAAARRTRALAAVLAAFALTGAGCASGDGPAGAAPSTLGGAAPSSPGDAASAASAGPSAPSSPSGNSSTPAASTPARDGASGSAATAPSPSSTPARDATPKVAGEVARGLDAPWGLAFLPGGDALVAERDSARIVRVAASGGRVTPVGKVPGVDPGGEGGLLGLALSPSFEQDRLVYAYFTAEDDNRIVRMRYDEPDRLGDPEVVFTGLDKSNYHNGGRIEFGPDGLLYVGVGDAANSSNAQDRSSYNGKILRLTPDGKPAPGNPFGDSPVYSLGHRNVQGLAWDARGQLWASEFGQDTFDELNRIEAGRNYGWPEVEGKGGGDKYVDPQVTWDTGEASPSGIAIAGDAVYMAALAGERLWRIPLAGDRAGKPTAFLTERYGRLRTVALAPDGSLWLTTSNTDGRGDVRDGDDRILRLELR